MTLYNTLRRELLATVFAISSALLASPQIAQAAGATDGDLRYSRPAAGEPARPGGGPGSPLALKMGAIV